MLQQDGTEHLILYVHNDESLQQELVFVVVYCKTDKQTKEPNLSLTSYMMDKQKTNKLQGFSPPANYTDQR
jgi:hypothetical protein